MKILLFGGGFDPTHRGHIETSLFVRDERGYDKLIFVPTGTSPHKQNKKKTDAATRIELLRRSIEGISGVDIETFETEQTGVVYFWQTLQLTVLKYTGAELGFLIGSDWISKLDRWRNWRYIKSVAKPICMVRPGYVPEDTAKYATTDIINVPVLPISSTALREKLALGLYEDELVQKWIMPKALELIREKSLYLDPSAMVYQRVADRSDSV